MRSDQKLLEHLRDATTLKGNLDDIIVSIESKSYRETYLKIRSLLEQNNVSDELTMKNLEEFYWEFVN